MSDNVSGLIPPLTEDEMAAMSAPPRSLYRTQRDGDLVRAASEWEIVQSAQYTVSVRSGRLQLLPVLHGEYHNTWSALSWPDDGYEYAVCRRKPMPGGAA